MPRQQNFPFAPVPRLIHGGELAKGRRKSERPIRTNKPIHVVLRAKRSGLKTRERRIQCLIKKYSEKFNIKLYRTSINSNHIHLLLVTPRRLCFQHFLRSVTGLIARLMGKGKLWENLAFSRIANWGKEFRTLVGYIHKNQLEALGLISYVSRTNIRDG